MFVKQEKIKPVKYTINIDDELIEADIVKCYVVNSGSTGVKVDIGDFNPTDGVLDIFALDGSLHSYASAAERFLHFKTKLADTYLRHGKNITIKTATPQSVWADGEYIGKTPLDIKIMAGALKVLADKPTKHKIKDQGNSA